MVLEAIPQKIWNKLRRGTLAYLVIITASGLLLWKLQIDALTAAWQIAFWLPIGLAVLLLAFDLALGVFVAVWRFQRCHVKHRYFGLIAACLTMMIFMPMGIDQPIGGMLIWFGGIAIITALAWLSDYLPLERHGGRVAVEFINRLESRR